MDSNFFLFITQNSQLITVLTVVVGGVFSLVKWLDSRNREHKEKRYSNYMNLISTISGANRPDDSTPRMTEQIAAVWFLLDYKEYADITYKIFTHSDLNEIANPTWKKHVVPNIQLLLKEIEPNVWLINFLNFPIRFIASKLPSLKD